MVSHAPPPAYAVPLAAIVLHLLAELPSGSSLWAFALLGFSVWLIAPARRSGWVRFAAVGSIAFAWCGMQALDALQARLPLALDRLDLVVDARIAAVSDRALSGVRIEAHLVACEPGARWCAPGRRVSLAWYGEDARRAGVAVGELWRLRVRLRPPIGRINPHGFDAELRDLQQGVVARGYVRTRAGDSTIDPRATADPAGEPHAAVNVRIGAADAHGLVERARDLVERSMATALAGASETARGTLIALVTGRQQAIPARAWEEFNRTGIGHLMSISGLHVTMFAALTLWMMRALLRQRFVPVRLLARIPARSIAINAAVVAAFLYAVFSGWGLPAQRTCWMLAIAALATMFGRGRDIGAVLGAAAAVVTCFDPWAVRSAGFWLSFAAVAAIMSFGTGWRRRVERSSKQPTHRRLLRIAAVLREAGRTQWAASLALVPLGAAFFGTISLVGPLANALAIPLVSMAITPLAILGAVGGLLLPALAGWALWVPALLCEGLLAMVRAMAEWSHAVFVSGAPTPWTLAAAAAACALLLRPIHPLPRMVGALGLAPLLAGPPTLPAGALEILAFDVGQGTAVLVRTARHDLLFDTGPGDGIESGAGDRSIAPVLRALRIERLSELVLSHADGAHLGGAEAMIRAGLVRQVRSGLPPQHTLNARAPSMQHCRAGQQWVWDLVRFEVLHPASDPQSPTAAVARADDQGCVLRIVAPGGSALVVGDLGGEAERALTRALGSAGLAADVLLVGRHGGRDATSDAFLAAVTPRWAVIQTGVSDPKRQPHAAAIRRLSRAGAVVLRTDQEGAVSLRFDPRGDGMAKVRKFRRDDPPYWRIGSDDRIGERGDGG